MNSGAGRLHAPAIEWGYFQRLCIGNQCQESWEASAPCLPFSPFCCILHLVLDLSPQSIQLSTTHMLTVRKYLALKSSRWGDVKTIRLPISRPPLQADSVSGLRSTTGRSVPAVGSAVIGIICLAIRICNTEYSTRLVTDLQSGVCALHNHVPNSGSTEGVTSYYCD